MFRSTGHVEFRNPCNCYAYGKEGVLRNFGDTDRNMAEFRCSVFIGYPYGCHEKSGWRTMEIYWHLEFLAEFDVIFSRFLR